MTDSRDLPPEAAPYLAATPYVDHHAPGIRALTQSALQDLPPDATDLDRAIRLFRAVRDGFWYDPYTLTLDADDYRASRIATRSAAYCVPKAILLTACLRAAGIPAALGFADVRNHLNTPRLQELMGTDLFIYHGYVQLWAGGRSFKVTPAFNTELCARFGVRPLDFDGTGDALFHEFDQQGRHHMEYVCDRGLFADFPADEILPALRATYPRFEDFSHGRVPGQGAAGIDAGFAAGAGQ